MHKGKKTRVNNLNTFNIEMNIFGIPKINLPIM